MQLILDGKLRKNDIEAGEMLETVENFLQEKLLEDRVIVSCSIDGMEVENLEEALNTVSGKVQTVELCTRDRSILLQETVDSAREYCSSLKFALENIALDLNAGKEINTELWRQIIEGLEWLTSACTAVEGQKDLLPRGTEDLTGAIQEMNSTLEELAQVMEGNDLVTLADLLEYELSPQLERLKEILGVYAEHFQNKS